MKKYLTLLSLFLFTFFTPTQTYSQTFKTPFSVSYDLTYSIDTTGKTTVVQHGFVTNLSSEQYVTQLDITFDNQNITNIAAYDEIGPIEPLIFSENGSTRVTLPFNQKILGIGKSFTFTLTYTNLDTTKQHGQLWEIIIPKPDVSESISSYDVKVVPPTEWGIPTIVRPHTGKADLSFDKTIIQDSGINIVFGNKQSYDYSLTYHLKNEDFWFKKIPITLPPDTQYQDVYLTHLSRKMVDEYIDSDGNHIAVFSLYPKEYTTIQAKGQIHVYSEPKDDKSLLLSQSQRETAISPQKFWEISNLRFQEITQQLTSAPDVYKYVVQTLFYDEARTRQPVVRFGADRALADPLHGLCLEFTDSFIALARRIGIPARANYGYAFTDNPKLRPLSYVNDILHAWPEYYDKDRKAWIPIDPTWEKTTKGFDYFTTWDFNHITFAILNESSTLPLAAGTYKKADPQEKDVTITFSKNILKTQPKDIQYPSTNNSTHVVFLSVVALGIGVYIYKLKKKT